MHEATRGNDPSPSSLLIVNPFTPGLAKIGQLETCCHSQTSQNQSKRAIVFPFSPLPIKEYKLSKYLLIVTMATVKINFLERKD